MVNSLNDIKAPIAAELQIFEKKFRESMKSGVPLLNRITRYVFKRKGKQIRPMLVFLSAKMCGDVKESTYHAASLIEMLHTATLIHDDVVDESYERRGFFSINALWQNKISVLLGDYLLSRGLLLALENKAHLTLEIVATAVKEMSEGEILQLEKARRLDIKEPIYFEIIRQKTASLMAAACSAGAASINSDPEVIEKFRSFGEKIGIAYQIRDDLMDFGDDDIGKPKGIDIKEKKMTLPLIYTLNQASFLEKRRIINTIKNHNKNPARVAEVIQIVRAGEGIPYAKKVMKKYEDEALKIIESIPPSDARTAMIELVHFMTDRKK